MYIKESVGEHVAKKALGTAAVMGVVFVLGTVFSGGNPVVEAAAAKAAGLTYGLGGHGDGDGNDGSDSNDGSSGYDS